ncbi:MAG: uncharacterized protein KVP18_003437 [Porospora cf. gigantea A]|uniref:uncharacterized protein n=1 Tax=Porospora cf. gigantea A TaxID=2853593 RepID=UPI00355A49EB|nr:MAG: hypothetical protein KVP18_003437 [Porospora cf. gigantea A]
MVPSLDVVAFQHPAISSKMNVDGSSRIAAFVDLDHTLMPTQWIFRSDLTEDNCARVTELRESGLVEVISDFLRAVTAHENVKYIKIITNASPRVVELYLHLLPDFKQLLEELGIPIDSTYRWKEICDNRDRDSLFAAMKSLEFSYSWLEAQRLAGVQTICSIGDQAVDMEAALDLLHERKAKSARLVRLQPGHRAEDLDLFVKYLSDCTAGVLSVLYARRITADSMCNYWMPVQPDVWYSIVDAANPKYPRSCGFGSEIDSVNPCVT